MVAQPKYKSFKRNEKTRFKANNKKDIDTKKNAEREKKKEEIRCQTGNSMQKYYYANRSDMHIKGIHLLLEVSCLNGRWFWTPLGEYTRKTKLTSVSACERANKFYFDMMRERKRSNVGKTKQLLKLVQANLDESVDRCSCKRHFYLNFM